MYSKLTRIVAIGSACAALSALLSGCGGTGQPTTLTRSGRVRLSISWPAKSTAPPTSRYIPGYASSLVFELHLKSDPTQRFNLVVNRPSNKPSTQLVTFQQLLATGTYELAGQANALPDGQGAAVASGGLEIQVSAGMNPVALTLSSTIRSLLVLGQPLTASTSQAVTLQSGAFDPNGAGLLLPDGALTWSIVSGSQFGTITTGGKLTATAPGTIKVHVEEPVTKVFAEANVTVSTQGSNTGLAQSGYPKPGADLGGTGLVQGSGAAGVLAWHFDLGQRGVGTPVLGTNNLLFAINQDGKIFALNATTGAQVWQAKALAGSLLAASLIAADDNTLIVGTSGGVEAYDMATGLQKWTNTDYSITGLLTLAAGKVYAPSHDQGMAVIDSRTGTSLTPLPAINNSGGTYTYDGSISGNTIYYISESYPISRAQKLLAVNLTTGVTVWSKDVTVPTGSGYLGTYPVVSPTGTVYIGFGDGNLLAFDAQTGAQKATVAGMYGTYQQPSIGSDGSVNFLSAGAKTARYDSGLSNRAWTSTVGLKQTTVGSDGVVYGTGLASDGSGHTAVFALNGADGTVKWMVPLVLGTNAASGGFGTVNGYTAVGSTGTIYVVSIDGQIYAIK